MLHINKQITELRNLIHEADARRASQLLIDLCDEYPLLAGILTLVRQGSMDQAINNVALFNAELALELRGHIDVLHQIRAELNKQPAP